MSREIESRLDQIEEKIHNREPLNKFDIFWMARRLRQYEHQLILATEVVESLVPGVGELDPTKAGELVDLYMRTLDTILKLEQKKNPTIRRPGN